MCLLSFYIQICFGLCNRKLWNYWFCFRLIASDYLVIVAIDFGTTFSGFAWSMRSELEDYQHGQCKSDVPPISISQNWNSPSQNAVSLKTPTCLLLDAEKEFRSFGYKAENEYVHLAREKSHQRYYFFQRFKMVLHEVRLHKLFKHHVAQYLLTPYWFFSCKWNENYQISVSIKQKIGKTFLLLYSFVIERFQILDTYALCIHCCPPHLVFGRPLKAVCQSII